METQPHLTIGDLARLTGLAPATLRMWEQRHGFPVPHRLDSGHRRYSQDDVATVKSVLQRRDAGTRLDLAIAQAMSDAEPAAPSVYAHLRQRHPTLASHRLHKSTLIALSWAIEDEFCAKADRASIWGAFQSEQFYAPSRRRWAELARVSRAVTVLADFERTDPGAVPQEVALAADSPMHREWVLVCDAVDLPIVLTAWELPGQAGVPDRQRLFESMWSVDPRAVHDAARVCSAVARDAGLEVVPTPTYDDPRGVVVEQAAVTALFNRMVAYVDEIR